MIPISADQHEYADQVLKQLVASGIRAENWNEAESMQNRIRKAEQQKVPYMLIVGKKEAAENTVSARLRGNHNLGVQPLSELIANVQAEVKTRAL